MSITLFDFNTCKYCTCDVCNFSKSTRVAPVPVPVLRPCLLGD